MTDTVPADPDADLAFLKRMALAGQGRPAPLAGLMTVFGLAYGLMFTAQYGLTRALPPADDGMAVALNQTIVGLSVLAHAVVLTTLIWSGWSVFRRRSLMNRAAAGAWAGAFLGLVTMVAGFLLFGARNPPEFGFHHLWLLPSVLLALWGAAWLTAGVATRRRWAQATGGASFGAAILAALFANTLELFLTAGASLLLLAFLPGLLLMRRPSS